MRSILCLLFALLSLTMTATEPDPIFAEALGNHLKLMNTKTLDLKNGESLHLVDVYVKSTKQRLFIPYYVNDQKEVVKLKDITKEENSAVIAHHRNGDTVTYVTYFEKEEYITITDVNLSDGNTSTSASIPFKKAEYKISRDNESVLIYKEDDKELSFEVLIVENSESQISKEYNIQDADKKIFEDFWGTKADEIYDDEYTDYGSLNKKKLYNLENNILFLVDDGSDHINTFSISLDNSNDLKINTIDRATTFDDTNSLVFNNDIYSLAVTKDKMDISIYDLASGTLRKSLTGNEHLAGTIIDEKSLDKIRRKASKNVLHPSLKVSETEGDDILVKISYKNPGVYNYYNNFWWHHWHFHNMMMQQQQMMMNQMNSIPRFEPNGTWMDTYYDIEALSATETEFEFVLKPSLAIEKKTTQKEVLKEIEKRAIFDKYDEGKRRTDNASGVFHDEEAVFIFFDKKEKMLKIDVVPLD